MTAKKNIGKHGRKPTIKSPASIKHFKNIRDIITLKIIELESKGVPSREISSFVKEQANYFCGVPGRK